MPTFREALIGNVARTLWRDGSDFDVYRIQDVIEGGPARWDAARVAKISYDEADAWLGLGRYRDVELPEGRYPRLYAAILREAEAMERRMPRRAEERAKIRARFAID